MRELLNSGKVGNNKTEEEILKAWSETGYLEGLIGDMRKYVAFALERAAKELLTDKYGKDWKYEFFVGPIIRRVMSEINSDEFDCGYSNRKLTKEEIIERKLIILEYIDVETIIKKINDSVDKVMDVLHIIYNDFIIDGSIASYKYPNMDIEAEACSLMAKLITEDVWRHYANYDVFEKINGKKMFFSMPKNSYGIR